MTPYTPIAPLESPIHITAHIYTTDILNNNATFLSIHPMRHHVPRSSCHNLPIFLLEIASIYLATCGRSRDNKTQTQIALCTRERYTLSERLSTAWVPGVRVYNLKTPLAHLTNRATQHTGWNGIIGLIALSQHSCRLLLPSAGDSYHEEKP